MNCYCLFIFCLITCLKAKILCNVCRFKRSGNTSALIYIYSYGKISLELCNFSEKALSHKMRMEYVHVKEYDVNKGRKVKQSHYRPMGPRGF
jgi:hypothetical protein